MKLTVLLLCLPLLADTSTPKLTPDQMCQVNLNSYQQQIADLAKQLAEAQGELAKARRELILTKACAAANILTDCIIQSDGTIAKQSANPPATK